MYETAKELSKPKAKKPSEINVIKSIKNPFILKEKKDKKEIKDKIIKDRIIRYIRTLFKQEDDYYKSIVVGKFWNNSYIEYESNGYRNKILSL